MSRPKPGGRYTVVQGDTLRNIARAAYGNDQGARIARANERELQGRPLSAEGLPTLRPGDILEIPDLNAARRGGNPNAGIAPAYAIGRKPIRQITR